MDFDWTDEQVELRRSLRAFVDQRARPGWTHHDRDMAAPGDREAVIDFCRAMAEAGHLVPHWPARHGGRDAGGWEQTIVSEELWGAGEPRGPQYMNVNWIAPAIMLAGTEEQKERFLPPIARGSAMWCQGFSEPDAGSDLTSLTTRATRDGDVYVVDGQKIWTSYAHAADFCFTLVRTDPAASRGEGISILLVPMDLPGIEVRDIPNPWVAHLVHEVYFTDVAVPVANRLGEENRGWEVVREVLANERIGVARHESAERTLDAAVDAAIDAGIDVSEEGVADSIGTAYATCEAARALNYAAVDERARGTDPRRPIAATSRSLTGPMEGVVARACMDVLGLDGLIDGSAADRQTAIGTTAPIAAGSLEVQLDLVARNVLGLPKG